MRFTLDTETLASAAGLDHDHLVRWLRGWGDIDATPIIQTMCESFVAQHGSEDDA